MLRQHTFLRNVLFAMAPGAFACAALAQGCSSSDTSNPGGGGTGAPSGGGGTGGGGTGGPGGAAGTLSAGGPSSGGASGSADASATGGAAGAGGSAGAGAGGAVGTGGRVDAGARVDAGRADAAGAGGREAGADATGGAAGSVIDGGISCTTPPAAGELIGWATVDGMNVVGGTTGGGSATPVTVTTLAAFSTAIAGTAARVIYLNGSFAGTFSIGSNKTVVGLCGAKLQGHVSLSGSVNVIVRNLTIQGNNCTDSPANCSGGADAVTVGDNSHHVWFDHDDILDGSDGNLDITSGADFVTISFTKFHYSTARTDPLAGASGHRFSNLIGSADTVTTDAGHLNVTWHHNWWGDNVDQRMPRTRFGRIHVFNNLFTAANNSYCTNAGIQAQVLVENNVYSGVHNPLSPDANGSMLARGNLFQGTTGTTTAPATAFTFTPTYAYTLEPTATLAAAIMSGVGPH